MLFAQHDPYTMKAYDGDALIGYIPDLVSEVAEIAGFQYDLHLVKDNKYGALQEDGTWNGMIGELIDGVSEGRMEREIINDK